MKGDLLTENKDANFINSLAGKVAGVNINASSSGVGGISKVVMRGTKSIMQSSNALYVIDGMPMRSGNSTGSTEFGSQGTSEPIADINPDDIESMSVLTGAAAAALYGSEAANGAIVITTKRGQKGKTSVSYSSNLNWDNAFILPKFQSRYGTGIDGRYNADETRSWGAPLGASNSYGYTAGDDYLQTGFVSTQAISFSTGNDKNQTYASAAALNSKGIVPNNRYDRYNFSIRNTTSFLDDRMTLDVNASYIYQTDRNIEAIFFAANAVKFTHGGWFTLLIAGMVAIVMIIWYNSTRIRDSHIEFSSVDSKLALIRDLKNDNEVPRYASNIVYFSRSANPRKLENKLLYSIVSRQPKRADHYWIIHIERSDDPWRLDYKVDELIEDTMFFVTITMGFRVEPKISLYLRQVVEDLVKDGKVDITSSYPSLRRHGVAGDFRFVVINRLFSAESSCTRKDTMLLRMHDRLRHIGISDLKSMGLDTSGVVMESVPLIISTSHRRRIRRSDQSAEA